MISNQIKVQTEVSSIVQNSAISQSERMATPANLPLLLAQIEAVSRLVAQALGQAERPNDFGSLFHATLLVADLSRVAGEVVDGGMS